MLEVDNLNKDPRIIKAKQLIADAIEEHQSPLTGIRPPHPDLKQSYNELLSTFAKQRGGKLWYPFIGSGFGRGSLVELMDGSVKYDFICGIGPHFFGHTHPSIVETCIDAALSDTVMQGNLQQNIDSLHLSEALVQASKLPHCFLTTSGTMATENAIKIALQNKFPARRILAFDHCFSGRTLALSHITDKPSFREGLTNQMLVDYIPFFDPARPEESTKETLTALKKLLARYPKDYALMLFELVQGEGGFQAGTTEFFVALMTLLKDHQVAIIVDEVQTFGRLPELFAYHYFGLEKYVDIVSIGKLSQVCATLFTDAMLPRPGLLSQTFTGSTSAIRSSQYILQELQQNGYYGPDGKIQKIYDYFTNKLKALAKKHPELIKGPYGLGCMIVFTPLDGSSERVNRFSQELFDAGVMGFIAGSHPTRLRFLVPAGVVTNADIDKVCEIVEATLIKCSGLCT